MSTTEGRVVTSLVSYGSSGKNCRLGGIFCTLNLACFLLVFTRNWQLKGGPHER